MNYLKLGLITIFIVVVSQSLKTQTVVATITYGKKFNSMPLSSDTISHIGVKEGLEGINARILKRINDCEYTLELSKNESIFKL